LMMCHNEASTRIRIRIAAGSISTYGAVTVLLPRSGPSRPGLVPQPVACVFTDTGKTPAARSVRREYPRGSGRQNGLRRQNRGRDAQPDREDGITWRPRSAAGRQVASGAQGPPVETDDRAARALLTRSSPRIRQRKPGGRRPKLGPATQGKGKRSEPFTTHLTGEPKPGCHPPVC
jgi:hypothetical protein